MNKIVFAGVYDSRWIGCGICADGVDLTVRKNEEGTYDIEVEYFNGRSHVEYGADHGRAIQRMTEIAEMDEYHTYIPYYQPDRWAPNKIERFMRTLPPQMCDPFMRGFVLSADGTSDFVVRKMANGVDWMIGDKIVDFCGVLSKTRVKLNEAYDWQFSKL